MDPQRLRRRPFGHGLDRPRAAQHNHPHGQHHRLEHQQDEREEEGHDYRERGDEHDPDRDDEKEPAERVDTLDCKERVERVEGAGIIECKTLEVAPPQAQLPAAADLPNPPVEANDHTFGREAAPYSHSIVEGGFDEMSSATRFTPGSSLMIRLEIVSRRSYGRRAQSAVIASSLVTARITMG